MKTDFRTFYPRLFNKPEFNNEAISASRKERIVHHVVEPLLLIILTLTTSALKAQDNQRPEFINGVELSTGYSFLIYQSGYGFKGSQGVEFMVSKQVGACFKTETGFRSTLGTFLPEGFIRGVVYNHFNRWQPAIGLETGFSKRAGFDSSSELLKETREAMLKDIGYSFLSTHIELLSFDLKKLLNISLLEFDIGTHYRHFGRTLRAQSTLIRVRKSF